MANNAKFACIVCTMLGALLLAMGFLIESMVNSHVATKIPSFVALKDNSSPLFSVWREDEDKISRYISYYFLNVSNSDRVHQLGATPFVNLIGPFTYQEYRNKYNITWSANGTEISYLVNRTFKYIDTPCSLSSNNSYVWEGASPCSLPNNTLIATINIPLLAILEEMETMGWLEESIMNRIINEINAAFHNEDLFPLRTAHELIFGYNDTIMDKINSIARQFDTFRNKSFTPRPEYFPLQPQSSESLLPSTINSGVDDTYLLGSLSRWNGERSLSVWNGSCDPSPASQSYIQKANTISGSEGILFMPLSSAESTMAVFMEDLLRSVALIFNGTNSVSSVPLNRYVINESVFQNSSDYQPNCAFDSLGFTGLLNMSRILNAPLYASNPFFFDADPALLYVSAVNRPDPGSENVSGLGSLPQSSSDFDIDSWTGLCFRSHRRFQINARVTPTERIEVVRHVRRGGFYLPVMVFDERTALSQAVIDQWNSEIGDPLTAASNARLAGFITGAFLLSISVSLLIVVVTTNRCRPEPERQPLLARVQVAS